MRLGKNQISLLKNLHVGVFQVVVDSTSNSLIKKGFARAWGDNSLVGITPAGLRYLADEAEAGRMELAPDPKYLKAKGIAK